MPTPPLARSLRRPHRRWIVALLASGLVAAVTLAAVRGPARIADLRPHIRRLIGKHGSLLRIPGPVAVAHECPPEIPITGGEVVVLASGLRGAASVSVKDGVVFWASRDRDGVGVLACPLSGCDGRPGLVGAGKPIAVAVEGERAFWVENDPTPTLVSASLRTRIARTPPPHAAGGSPFVEGALVSDGRYLYTARGGPDGSIARCDAADGCASAAVLADGQADPRGLALDASHVYWTLPRRGEVVRAGLDGSERVTLASLGTSTSPWAIAVDGAHVYFTDYEAGRVEACPLAGCGDDAVTLASGQDQPAAIAVDATHVYWLNRGRSRGAGTGALLRVPVGGGAIERLAATDEREAGPGSLALAAGEVVWAGGGSVYEVRKEGKTAAR